MFRFSPEAWARFKAREEVSAARQALLAAAEKWVDLRRGSCTLDEIRNAADQLPIAVDAKRAAEAKLRELEREDQR